MPVYMLGEKIIFPDPNDAEETGLLGIGGDLKPERLLLAYKSGIFPWYSAGQPVLWWSPNPRCVLYPEKLHISRSFKRSLNNNPFEIKTNSAFKDVMLACATPRANGTSETGEAGTWITEAMLGVL